MIPATICSGCSLNQKSKSADNFKMQILIIEDNAIQALTLEMMLNQLGFTKVEKAYSAKKAYEILEHFKPDFMMVDINLECDESGIDVVKKTQERFDVPVLYITGNSDSFHRNLAKKTDYIDYIVKPVHLSQLKKILIKEKILTS